MLSPKHVVVTEEWKVRQALSALGITPDFVRNVAVAASSARADSLPVDPCSAPGTQAYIYGVRSIRLQLLPLDWRLSREGHVESTVSDELGIQLCFQNVDRACGDRNPEAISEKGSGSRKLINDGWQTELWEKVDSGPSHTYGSTPTVWVICVSTDEKRLRAEVSCPEVFEGDQFDGFSTRIFVVDEAFDPKPKSEKKSDDGDDYQDEVRISKR